MRTLGIDFGERRIGVAISDLEGRLATALETLERRSDRQAIGVIKEIARGHGVERLVIGLPTREDGRQHELADRIRRFGDKLAAGLALPVVFADESHTSVEAERRLRERGRDLRKDKLAIDRLAAEILLQQVLDSEAGLA